MWRRFGRLRVSEARAAGRATAALAYHPVSLCAAPVLPVAPAGPGLHGRGLSHIVVAVTRSGGPPGYGVIRSSRSPAVVCVRPRRVRPLAGAAPAGVVAGGGTGMPPRRVARGHCHRRGNGSWAASTGSLVPVRRKMDACNSGWARPVFEFHPGRRTASPLALLTDRTHFVSPFSCDYLA